VPVLIAPAKPASLAASHSIDLVRPGEIAWGIGFFFFFCFFFFFFFRPSAFSFLRLMPASNFLVALDRQSAGFAPLRIFPA